MKIILILLFLLASQQVFAAKPTQEKKRADFVLQCIKNGNPLSDEEPEDLVKQCLWTADKIYCKRKKREWICEND